MYDNPAYSNCKISQQQCQQNQLQNQLQKWNSSEDSVPSLEVIYSQPITSLRETVRDSLVYQEPTPPDTRSVTEFKKKKEEGELEEEEYYKFINPLYTSSSLNSTL